MHSYRSDMYNIHTIQYLGYLNKGMKMDMKKIKKKRKKQDDMISILKQKLDSPYTSDETRLEILSLFSDFFKDDWVKSSKGIEQWGKDLRRLAYEEE